MVTDATTTAAIAGTDDGSEKRPHLFFDSFTVYSFVPGTVAPVLGAFASLLVTVAFGSGSVVGGPD